jgi:hypothetical protein
MSTLAWLCGLACGLLSLPDTALAQQLTVTNGLALWLAADSGVTTNAGGLVSAWSDQSLAGHSASQASSGSQPTFLTNQLNGLPVVHFAGGQFFTLAGQVITSQTFTVVAMTRDQRTDTNFRELISNWDNTTANQVTSVFFGTTALNPVRARFTDNFGGADQGQAGVGIVSNPSNFFIFTAVSGASSVALYQNSANIAFRASPLTARNLGGGYVVGRQGTGTFDEYWHGDIAELIVFNRELTGSELNQVWQYLAARYGAGFAPSLNIPAVNSSEIQIVGLSNGQLAWTNSLPGTTCAVQWATSLAPADFTNVPGLGNILVTSPLMTATVPPSAGEVKFLRISQQMNLSLGLVAYYTFEGNANDLSGNTNNAAVTNDVTFVPGISGLAASFDGSTSYIQVNESPSLELAGPMTITAWVNPAAEGSLNCIVDKDANFLGYNLYLQNGGVQMRISSTGGTAAVTGGSVPLNTWSHVAGVFTGSQILVYLNGSLVGQVPAPAGLSNISKNLYIGMWGAPGSGRFFQGQIDNVRIYNRPLYQAELQVLAKLHQ